MKIQDKEKAKLWVSAEKSLTLRLDPEQLRTSGLISAGSQNWNAALLRLEEAVRHGIHDLQTLDALGEAAYQAKAPEALLPFQNLYSLDIVAIHMARAHMMLGQILEAREFLKLAKNTLLKTALQAVLDVEGDIEKAIEAMVAPFMSESDQDMTVLSYVEFWQALAPIADAGDRRDLVLLAERRLKALAYAKPVNHFNQSLRLLNDGEYHAGWKLYDWRLAPGSPCAALTSCAEIAMWEGEDLTGKSLLVILENGLGDQIFGLRYLKALEQEARHLEVAVGPELQSLVRSSFPSVKIHELEKVRDLKYWKTQKAPDHWTYSLSIPARALLCDPLGSEGYLRAPGELVQRCSEEIQVLQKEQGAKLPVHGIVWHGDIRTLAMRSRAYSLHEFLQETQVLKNPCVLVCLQKDITEDELSELNFEVTKANCILLNAAPSLHDFSNTAAWLGCLDRMWSCDTASAHAAGALSVPTTVMIRNKSIWHWRALPDLTSVWYKSVRIQYALAPRRAYMFEIRETV